jgi:hypothetical protein
LLKNIRKATPHNSPSTPTEEIIEQIADKIIENNKL